VTAYFAYGTTQEGFTHHRALGLGARVARVRTVAPYGIVVPFAAACGNPGCRFVHRMAALVPSAASHAEGDLFDVDSFDALDGLELAGPYVRGLVRVSDGSREWEAVAYPAAEPSRWLALVEGGLADVVSSYAAGGADVLKDCCVRDPGHFGPHDVVDLFAGAS